MIFFFKRWALTLSLITFPTGARVHGRHMNSSQACRGKIKGGLTSVHSTALYRTKYIALTKMSFNDYTISHSMCTVMCIIP